MTQLPTFTCQSTKATKRFVLLMGISLNPSTLSLQSLLVPPSRPAGHSTFWWWKCYQSCVGGGHTWVTLTAGSVSQWGFLLEVILATVGSWGGMVNSPGAFPPPLSPCWQMGLCEPLLELDDDLLLMKAISTVGSGLEGMHRYVFAVMPFCSWMQQFLTCSSGPVLFLFYLGALLITEQPPHWVCGPALRFFWPLLGKYGDYTLWCNLWVTYRAYDGNTIKQSAHWC